ncbi:hypothetical protein SUGI_0202840 [Cryptomeria japonica]|uniref:uncharacterized protein LOC131068589 n=1 Tax=Cryptomeria japonica TaxID=3369 RepID=UPI002408B02E|nr:uncharacterized protein LOC131068589 [Cryptomeria japonica]GLJ12997.1 hypothetical protein SUGI_0202840 [Cryptomeria japonica]
MNSSFKKLYLKRFLRVLKSLRKGTRGSQGSGDEVAEVPCSSRTIKLAADVSLALTANRSAWGRALLNRISSDEKKRPVLRNALEPSKFKAVMAQRAKYQSCLMLRASLKQAHMQHHKICSRQSSLSLYRFLCSKRIEPATSSEVEEFKRRTRQLKRLIPGGKSMDMPCLLGETAHYIAYLTGQVQVLQSLLNSAI